MAAEYVEQFFLDGSLLLTTYENCRTHEDLVRRDAREGKVNYHLLHGSQAVSGIQGVGKRSFMLCASSTLSAEMMTRFGTKNWIEIIDPLAFAEAISRKLPGFLQLRMAPCRYVSERSVERQTARPIMPDPAQLLQAARSGAYGGVEAAFHAMNRELADRLTDELDDDPYFIKEAVPFDVEDEFRFVWTVSDEVISPLVVNCKEASKYCLPGFSGAYAK